MSSTLGSSTYTGWKRRSSAASFSMCLRYSSSVVAPTARSSPRASIGLSRLAASTAPSAAPAPDDRVQLVHEQDDLALGLGDLLEHRLQAVLELAAVLRAGDQRADVERDDAPVAQRVGHVAGDDALGEALDDGRLAHARLADQHRVVLGAPARAPGSRAGPRRRGRSPGRACPARRPRSGRGRTSPAPGSLSSGFWSVTRCGPRTSCTASASWSREAPASTFGSAASASSRCSVETYSSPMPRASSSARLSSSISPLPSAGAHVASPLTVGRRVERLVGPPANALGVGARAAQHRHDDAALLLEQGDEQVRGRDLRVAARAGQPLSGGEGLLGLDCESISLHRKSKSKTIRYLGV